MEESGYRLRLGWGVLGIIGREGGIVIERKCWSWSEAVLDFFVCGFVIWVKCGDMFYVVGEVRWDYELKIGLHETR
jgi:hypothetical protein